MNGVWREVAYYFQMRCVLGFDGGGTKTTVVVIDEKGNVLGTGRAGASNPVRVGFERAIAEINTAAKFAAADACMASSAIVALCAGIAGTGDAEVREEMHVRIASLFPGIAMKIGTDLEIALAAAGAGPAIVLIAGTGSAAIGRGVAGQVRRAGGLGPQRGDEGSAADIGKKAVLAVRSQRECTGEGSTLEKRLRKKLGVANWSEIDDRVSFSAEETYPQLFPIVADAADAGNEIAREILRGAVRDLSVLVQTLVNELNLKEVSFRLAKTGGMIGHYSFFDAQLETRLREAAPAAKIGLLPILPAHAAALIALELIPERQTESSNADHKRTDAHKSERKTDSWR
jgi:glucosamine kinase